MRICVLQHVFDPHKGANHLPLYAANAEITFIVVCSICKIQQSTLPSNVRVITIPRWTGPYYYGCMDLRFARMVLSLHPTTDPFWQTFDIVHCNQIMGPALRQLRKTGVPLLLFIHHPVTADLEVALQESRGLERFLWRMKYALLVPWQRKMCHAASRIATVSETMRGRIAEDYAYDPHKIFIVPNGVDGSVFSPDPAAPLFDVIALGSFIHPRKGFRYLVEAYRSLSAKGFRIADVGRRSDAQVAVLRSIPGVTIHGTVDQEAVQRLIQRSSVLLSTALYEGFGLSLIEALACGRPAFAFGGGAVLEVLSPIDTELVVPVRDTSALVAKAEAFLRLSDTERKQRGEQYRKGVLAHYGIQQAADALRRLYTEMT